MGIFEYAGGRGDASLSESMVGKAMNIQSVERDEGGNLLRHQGPGSCPFQCRYRQANATLQHGQYALVPGRVMAVLSVQPLDGRQPDLYLI